jgi:hypothetical protein
MTKNPVSASEDWTSGLELSEVVSWRQRIALEIDVQKMEVGHI